MSAKKETNIEKAVIAVRDALDKEVGGQNTKLAQFTVQALAEAGLLIPDVPAEPITPDSDPKWAKSYAEMWDWVPDIEWDARVNDFFISVGKAPHSGELSVNAGFYDAHEDWDDMKPAELRNIAAVLIEAANYLEKGAK